MASRKMWIEVTVLEGPGHEGRAFSHKPEPYDLIPTSYEVKGRLSLDVKPQFLQAAMSRIGVPERPNPSASSSERAPIYEAVKEGDIQGDIDGMMSAMTGKKTSPFITLLGELVDGILRPGK